MLSLIFLTTCTKSQNIWLLFNYTCLENRGTWHRPLYGTIATDAYAYKIILDNLSFSDSDKDTQLFCVLCSRFGTTAHQRLPFLNFSCYTHPIWTTKLDPSTRPGNSAMNRLIVRHGRDSNWGCQNFVKNAVGIIQRLFPLPLATGRCPRTRRHGHLNLSVGHRLWSTTGNPNPSTGNSLFFSLCQSRRQQCLCNCVTPTLMKPFNKIESVQS